MSQHVGRLMASQEPSKLSRRRSEMSPLFTDNSKCPLPVARCQWPVASGPLPVASGQLPFITCRSFVHRQSPPRRFADLPLVVTASRHHVW